MGICDGARRWRLRNRGTHPCLFRPEKILSLQLEHKWGGGQVEKRKVDESPLVSARFSFSNVLPLANGLNARFIFFSLSAEKNQTGSGDTFFSVRSYHYQPNSNLVWEIHLATGVFATCDEIPAFEIHFTRD